jgi:hypothetical protein
MNREVIAVAAERFADDLARLGTSQTISRPEHLAGTVDAAIGLAGGENP